MEIVCQAALFDKSRTTITEHLQNIFFEGELQKESVCRKFRRTAADGKSYNTQFYNLDAIISVASIASYKTVFSDRILMMR